MPLGRRDARDDVAHAIASLASPQAAWRRGQGAADGGGLGARQPPRRRGMTRADERCTRGARRATRGASRHGRTRTREDQCLSSTFFGFGGDGTFAYWNAGVAFSASFVAPGR